MEFHEKLQKLRTDRQMTQEELAEKLYVSRAAVSKWESGRGYPSIDSLKALSEYFQVTVDELICGEEMVTLAEQDAKASGRQYTALICGVLDCLTVLLLFLPLFGGGGKPVLAASLLALRFVRPWLRGILIAAVSLTVLTGFCTVVLSHFDRPVLNRRLLTAGMLLLIGSTVLMILTRQPYAAVFCLCVLLIKGFFLWKSQ